MSYGKIYDTTWWGEGINNNIGWGDAYADLANTDFIMTVRTTTTSESFTIPTTGGGYNYNVDWGDGNTSGTITDNLGSNLLGDASITTTGSTTLVVSGDSFTSTSPSGDSGTALRPRLLWNTLTVGKRYRVQIDFTINSGTLDWSFYNGTSYEYDGVSTTSVDFTFTCNSASNVFFAIDGRNVYDVSVDFTIQEVIPTHTYASAGDYDIKISGTFPRIYFNNTGDKAKVIEVKNLGKVGWTNFASAFYGCSNMTSFTLGNSDTSNVTDFTNMFFACSGLTSANISSLDVSNATNLSLMFRGCSSLTNLDITSWDTSSVTNISQMFRFCSSIVIDPSNFDVTEITTATFFMENANSLTTAIYDATLIAWESDLQAQYPAGAGYGATININFGGSTYTSGGAAETARTSLINTFGWTITDGGGLGSELISNGGFDTDTIWLDNGAWSIADGVSTCVNGNNNIIYQSGICTVGLTYRVAYTITEITSGQIRARCGNSGNGTSRTSAGTYTEDITCAGSTAFSIQAEASFTTNASIDNVSVKLIS